MENVDLNRLPALRDERGLSSEQIAHYEQNGHILLQDVCDAEEVRTYRSIIGQWVEALNYHSKPIQERDTYGKAFIQISNLWLKSEAVKRFVMARRFAKLAADLMGVDAVRLYHDQALYKEPGGGHTPWHQDQIYWPLDTDRTITMWMPLVPIPEQVGSMTFASESHKLGYVNKQLISDESHKTLKPYIENKQMSLVTYGGMNAGDATFHAGWTMHTAPGNPTETMREVMTIIYFADGARLAEPDSAARRNDFESLFPGMKAGDLAASGLTPLVYSRTATV